MVAGPRMLQHDLTVQSAIAQQYNGLVPWLPYRQVELRSELSADAAREALAGHVGERGIGFFESGRCPFEGSVYGSSFDIQRVNNRRNTLLPQIYGSIRPEATGCRITLTMTPNPF